MHEDGVVCRNSPTDELGKTYHDSAFDGRPWGGLCKYQKFQNPKGSLIALVFRVSSQLLDHIPSHENFVLLALVQLVAQFDRPR